MVVLAVSGFVGNSALWYVGMRATTQETSGAVATASDGPDGELRLAVYAERPARFLLDVTATYPLASQGTYTIRLADVRPGTESDRQMAEAQREQSQAERLRETDDYPGALSHAQKALALREKAFGASAPEIVRSLLLVGQLEDARAHFDAADRLYAGALEIQERSSGRDSLLFAQVLDSRAANLIARDRFTEAEPLVREALAIRSRIVGNAHFLFASSLGTLADLHHGTANVKEGPAAADRALDVAAKSYRPDDIVLGDFTNRVARAQLVLGNFARAEQLYRESWEARKKAAGAESLAAAKSLSGLATAALLSNDNVAAEERCLGALAITEGVLGPDHPLVAMNLQHLGQISYRRRDYPTALARYRRALEIREKAFGAVHDSLAATLNNMGLVYWRQNDYPRAEEFYGRALRMLEQLYGPEHPRLTYALANLGIIAKETGNYALAEERYRRALAIKEKQLGPAHPELIPIVESLGILYRDRGDYQRAEEMLARTLRLTESSLGPDHRFVARHLGNLAQLYWASGDLEKAYSARARLLAVEEHNFPLDLSIGSERQKLAYFEPFLDGLDKTITFHVRQPHASAAARDLALTTLLRRKGRIFDALVDNISAFRQRASPQDQVLLDQFSRVTASLAAAARSESTKASLADRQRQIAELAEERERLEADLQRRSAGYLSPSRPLMLADAQNAVPADAALIEFARYSPFDPKESIESGDRYGEPRYVVYLLRRTGEPQWKDLGPAKIVDDAVERFRTALADPSRQDVRRRSTELRGLLIGPLQALVAGVPHLLISPDGPLNLIPSEALRGANGRYLVEDHLISYVTTGRDLTRMQTPRPSPGAAIVFADPAFGERSARQQSAGAGPASRLPKDSGGQSSVHFTRLAATLGEAKRILDALPDAQLRAGADATETALKGLHRPRILHIATHGFFHENGGRATDTQTPNPLLRSGLVLAGANLPREGADDGILTALEAANLDLWGTELVTLSACDTGIGVVRDGEGVYGLRRAFFLAGAESLVMSLWPVSDLITRDIMAGYYAGLANGLGRGAALRRMQLRMLKRPGRAHPFYWASFIQAGDWATLEARR